MSSDHLKYQIALTLVPGVGAIAAKKLIAYCGGAEAVFQQKKAHLLKIPSIGEKVATAILSTNVLDRAEEEMDYISTHNIRALFYLNPDYPQRLLHCEDGPIILYTKGAMDLNAKRIVSIVGTRKVTVKGKLFCEKLVEELTDYQPLIVSGLAYGVDITAHKAALNNQLPTLGILACGLDEIYPKNHTATVKKMLDNGGIASDYHSNTKLFPTQFAERNRIIAGLSDATIVIESSAKGGSLITADLANGYNRDVFAVPGRPDDSQSVGCNQLIKHNKAALIDSAKDIEYIMGWEKETSLSKEQVPQLPLFVDLTGDEQQVLKHFTGKDVISIDQLSLQAKLPVSKTTAILLGLEFKNLVKAYPGKVYSRI